MPTFPFKIGADPEFNIIFNNKKASAIKIIPFMINKKENKECDEGFEVADAGNIGWDGHEETGEMRPAPSNDPAIVVSNIGKLLHALTEKINIFELSTNSSKAPVGGHIHMEINKENSDKLDAIHKKFSIFTLPLLLGENKINMFCRTKGGYGELNDYRAESPADNIYTYEFRTPTAEWLITPKITQSTLAYCGVVFNEVLNNPNFAKMYKDIIFKNQEQMKCVHKLVIMDLAMALKEYMETIKKAIKTFALYPMFKEECDYILNPAKVLKDKSKFNYDISQGWGLNTKPTTRQLMSVRITETKIQNIDFDVFSPIIKINYNPDYNVTLFAQEIQKKILAFNWKLKNYYYFYGLRKNIKDFIAINKKGLCLYHGDQIKTVSDAENFSRIHTNLNARFNFQLPYNTDKERMEISNKHILVGIPYEIRQKKDFKAFLKFILRIENNEFEATKINSSALAPTSCTPTEHKENENSLANTYNKDNIDPEEIFRPDNLSDRTEEGVREYNTMIESNSQSN